MAGHQCNIDTFNSSTVHVHVLGELDIKCHQCGALGFLDKNKGNQTHPHLGCMCCNQGKVILNPLPLFSKDYFELITSNSQDSVYF